MEQTKTKVSVEDIRAMILQLPAQEILSLLESLEERAETLFIMRLAETGFREWAEPGEDIYDDQPCAH